MRQFTFSNGITCPILNAVCVFVLILFLRKFEPFLFFCRTENHHVTKSRYIYPAKTVNIFIITFWTFWEREFQDWSINGRSEYYMDGKNKKKNAKLFCSLSRRYVKKVLKKYIQLKENFILFYHKRWSPEGISDVINVFHLHTVVYVTLSFNTLCIAENNKLLLLCERNKKVRLCSYATFFVWHAVCCVFFHFLFSMKPPFAFLWLCE